MKPKFIKGDRVVVIQQKEEVARGVYDSPDHALDDWSTIESGGKLDGFLDDDMVLEIIYNTPLYRALQE